MSDAEDRIEDSRDNFQELVWPEIAEWFVDDPDAAELIATEGDDHNLCEGFDTIGGVDFWLIDTPENRMMSIASRVQPEHEYASFTIRYRLTSGNDTEHHKRLKQYHDSIAHLPTWTVQAYVDETLGVLQNAATISTDDLYRYIDRCLCPIDEDIVIHRVNEPDFYPVWWSDLSGISDLRVYNWERADLKNKLRQATLPLTDGGDGR